MPRSRVLWQKGPGHQIWAASLERLVRPEDALASEPAPFGDALRRLILRMDQQEQPLDAVQENPVGDKCKCSRGNPTTSSLMGHPVVRLRAALLLVHCRTDLTEHAVLNRIDDREPRMARRPPLVRTLDPLRGFLLRETILHEREAQDFWIDAGRRDGPGVLHAKLAQRDLPRLQRRIRWHPSHGASLADKAPWLRRARMPQGATGWGIAASASLPWSRRSGTLPSPSFRDTRLVDLCGLLCWENEHRAGNVCVSPFFRVRRR